MSASVSARLAVDHDAEAEARAQSAEHGNGNRKAHPGILEQGARLVHVATYKAHNQAGKSEVLCEIELASKAQSENINLNFTTHSTVSAH